jgi:hypothetical protein
MGLPKNMVDFLAFEASLIEEHKKMFENKIYSKNIQALISCDHGQDFKLLFLLSMSNISF